MNVKCQTRIVKTQVKLWTFFTFKMSFCELWQLFSRAPIRNFLWCYYRWLITSLALDKGIKINAICFKLFWHKVFVHWKLKLLSFLVDSVLVTVTILDDLVTGSWLEQCICGFIVSQTMFFCPLSSRSIAVLATNNLRFTSPYKRALFLLAGCNLPDYSRSHL